MSNGIDANLYISQPLWHELNFRVFICIPNLPFT